MGIETFLFVQCLATVLMDESNSNIEPIEVNHNSDLDDNQLGDVSVEKRQKKIINKLYVRLSRAKKKTLKLITQHESLKSRLSAAGEDLLTKMTEIKKGAETNDPFCVFIMDQINNRFKKKKSGYRWSDLVIQSCRTLRAFNPEAYARMKQSELMILPQKKTLCNNSKHRNPRKSKNTELPNSENSNPPNCDSQPDDR